MEAITTSCKSYYLNFLQATEPHLLETYTPEVTQAYIRARLESVAVVVRDGLEDPLDDAGMVTQQLDQLSVIGRCEYGKTCQLLVQLFDQVGRRLGGEVHVQGGPSASGKEYVDTKFEVAFSLKFFP